MTEERIYGHTRSGKPITNAMVYELANEAENDDGTARLASGASAVLASVQTAHTQLSQHVHESRNALPGLNDACGN